MDRFELDPEQVRHLEYAFLSPAIQDGMQEKYEFINEKLHQTAKQLYSVTKKCSEQQEGLKKLQEAQFWFDQAVKKYGAKK